MINGFNGFHSFNRYLFFNLLFSVLCPNGTIFNQEVFVCDWWFNFDCSSAEGLYGLNDENAAEAAAAGSASAPQAGYGAGRR